MKLSIIITAFNQEQFIGQCIQSVIDQTYDNWECIIVNDGSIDETEKICHEFVNKDARIQYYFQKNRGVSAARNLGFSKVTGEFIHFLDGDDFIAPDKFSVQLEYMEEFPEIGVTYTNHKHYLQSKQITVQYQFKILNENPLQQILFEYDNGVSIPIHTAILRRDIWGDGEEPFALDYSDRYEDWIFWVRITLKGIKFHFLNYDLAFYRIHDNNFCNHAQEAQNSFQAALCYISNLLPLKDRKIFLDIQSNRFLQNHVINQNKIKSYIKSILYLLARGVRKASRIRDVLANRFTHWKDQKYKKEMIRKLQNRNFSIISNNCWGGGVYEDLDLPYLSPTVGLFFYSSCYIIFVENLSFYLSQPIKFVNTSKYQKANDMRKYRPYPIGVLNDEVEIHFLHYLTKSDAQEKWDRRKSRVNFTNTFMSFSDNEDCTLAEIKRFDKLPYPKVFFSSVQIPQIYCLVWLKKFSGLGRIGDIYTNRPRYRHDFNVVKWLNQSKEK